MAARIILKLQGTFKNSGQHLIPFDHKSIFPFMKLLISVMTITSEIVSV